MKTFASSVAIAVASLAFAGSASAQAPSPPAAPATPPVSPYKLTLDAGLVNASGNTDVTTFNAGDRFEYKGSSAGFAQFLNAIYGRASDSVTTEQIKAGMRVDVKLVSIVHGFVSGTYERNRFAGIARRFEEAAGLALRMIDIPTDLWTVELGSSVNQEHSTAAVSRDYVALRVASLYRHNFTKTANLTEAAEVLPDLEDSRNLLVNSETALVAPLSGHVAFKVSYVVKFDNLPEPGFKKTDRVLSSGLQIAF